MSLDREIWFARSQNYGLRKSEKDIAFYHKKPVFREELGGNHQRVSRNKTRKRSTMMFVKHLKTGYFPTIYLPFDVSH
jgi:hypothetical protein